MIINGYTIQLCKMLSLLVQVNSIQKTVLSQIITNSIWYRSVSQTKIWRKWYKSSLVGGARGCSSCGLLLKQFKGCCLLKCISSWTVTPRYGATYCLHLQGRTVSQAGRKYGCVVYPFINFRIQALFMWSEISLCLFYVSTLKQMSLQEISKEPYW